VAHGHAERRDADLATERFKATYEIFAAADTDDGDGDGR
jgi:hypothetical protein